MAIKQLKNVRTMRDDLGSGRGNESERLVVNEATSPYAKIIRHFDFFFFYRLFFFDLCCLTKTLLDTRALKIGT